MKGAIRAALKAVAKAGMEDGVKAAPTGAMTIDEPGLALC